jgi:coenzyme F420 biosynthesis associated uncharacterized protein
VSGVQLIDWSTAATVGTRLVPPGPRLPLAEAVAVVDSLQAAAQEADRHVRAFTGLDVASDSAPAVVVDRPGWIRSNVESFRSLIEPLLDVLQSEKNLRIGSSTARVGSRVTGAETGALLAYLATRVLGQFELLGPAPDGQSGGRLTLVAPNIVATERLLSVPAEDFRLWVCLHEVTHRTQFAAAPWLQDHVRSLLREWLLATDFDSSVLVARLGDALRGAVAVARGDSELSLVELVQSPEQRAVLDRVTGLMSLLEGHADVVMDGVGPDVVQDVGRIRSRFEHRRRSANPVERAVRRLFGIEMKMKQYAEGARFVRAVVDAGGMDALNKVWTGPDLLPDVAEIREPHRWLARTGGPAPSVAAG